MKKLLLSMMALAVLGSAEAKKVKFQVDMTGQTISANGLHIAGNFQAAAGAPGDWNPSATSLTNGGSGNIYSVIVDIPANKYYEFKFINDNNWGAGEESIPAISKVESAANGGSNGNRWLYIDSTANDTTVFPAILFGGSAPAGMFAVRFAVDMKNETVSANGVHIAGTAVLPNWTPAANNMANLFTNNKVYEYISYLAAGTYEYKFVNGNDWNAPSVPENVPASCATGGNRSVVVSASAALPKVCFASCIACPTAAIPVYNIKFRIDMTNSVCNGGFDSVTVAGAKIKLIAPDSSVKNWGDAARKLIDANNDKIFEVTIPIDSGECEFKFRSHKNGSTDWEGIANRIIQLHSDSTLTATCFNSTTVCNPLPAPSNITFIVDLRDTIPGTVFLIGTFQSPNWQAGAIRMAPLSGYPGVFKTTVNAVCPASFSYKFVNAFDGDSSKTQWEETFPIDSLRGCTEPSGVGGFNRVYTRANANPMTLSYKFNSCLVQPNVGINEVTLSSSFKLFPNPAEAYTMVEFNDNNALHNVVVMDIAGKVVQSFNNYKQNTLLINTDEMGKGIYFIKASNTRNESVTSKLIVR